MSSVKLIPKKKREGKCSCYSHDAQALSPTFRLAVCTAYDDLSAETVNWSKAFRFGIQPLPGRIGLRYFLSPLGKVVDHV